MKFLFSVICQTVVGLMGVLSASGSGLSGEGATSSASVSKPGEGKFDYNIDHSHYGSVYGWAYPHGYGGLGDSSGGYKSGDAHYVGALPNSLSLSPSSSSGLYGHGGSHGGYTGYGYDGGHVTGVDAHGLYDGNSYGTGYAGLYDSHSTSYSNYNQKSSDWSNLGGLKSHGYGGEYEAESHGWYKK